MDSAELFPEAATSPHTPLFHIAPRDTTPGDSAPAFFAQFDATGRILELLTPTTRESYGAQVAHASSPG